MKQNLFDLPHPILIQEAKAKTKNQICVRDGKVARNKHSLTRPLIPDHICIKEGNCEICRWFINMEERERSFINDK